MRTKSTHAAEQNDPDLARKLWLVNLGLLLSAAAISIGVISQAMLGWFQTAVVNTGFVIAALTIFAMKNWSVERKVLAACLWVLAFILWDLSFGLISGLQYLLLSTPAILFYLFRAKHRKLIALATVINATIFIAADYYFPWQLSWGEPLWENLEGPFANGGTLHPLDYFFIFNILSFQFVLFMISNAGSTALERAEQALATELNRSDALLNAILPTRIATRLKDSPGATIAEDVSEVTILFADIAGFTAFASARTASETVVFLNRLFEVFDNLIERHGLEKIKTIGDSYMVAGGLNGADADHPQRMADLALDMIEQANSVFGEAPLSLRIGIHRGPATAGVIGNQRPFYDVWGDTVNVASRMESTSEPGRAQVTPEMMDLLGEKFDLTPRNPIQIKGKGRLTPYWLIGRK
ncbi:MAG: adenylate/guanylate cyclase domain-containing protein [Pseudomonadota bacterium]